MADDEICIYCGQLWRVGHTENCPQTTGLYPVSKHEDGVICAQCRGGLGTHYTTVEHTIVCVGCAADITLLGYQPSWKRTP